MNILMTGYSAPQVGSTRSPIQRQITPQALAEVLSKDHTVTIAKFPEADPRLRKADLLILFLTPPHNLLSRNAATGILNAAQRLNKPLLAFFDDWQVKQVVSGHRTVGKHALVRVKRKLKEPSDWLYSGDKRYQEEHAEDITTVCRIFDGAETWPKKWHWACPMFSWGEHELIFKCLPSSYPRDRFSFIDPSPAWPLPMLYMNEEDKLRRWLMVSLLNRTDWLTKRAPAWPVDMGGNRKVGVRYKTEKDIMVEVGKHWGILSPAYSYATGCGWYRSRFNYSAHMRTVLYADELEVMNMHGYHIPLASIERMDKIGLLEAAHAQREIFQSYVWNYARLRKELNMLVERTVS